MARIDRILSPIDFSEFSAKAYGYALSLAQHCRARQLVQHTIAWVISELRYFP